MEAANASAAGRGTREREAQSGERRRRRIGDFGFRISDFGFRTWIVSSLPYLSHLPTVRLCSSAFSPLRLSAFLGAYRSVQPVAVWNARSSLGRHATASMGGRTGLGGCSV